MKKYISFLVVISVLISSFVCYPVTSNAVSVPSAKLTDYRTIPNYDNIFTLESDVNTEYVLLDKLSDGYLVMTNKVHDAVVFDSDGTQKFDPSDENNIAYYLNNTFLNEVLPKEMIPFIAERGWKVEGGNVGGNCPETYIANCKISLLSFEEYNKYYKKFGTVDHNNEIDWYLRTGDGAKAGNVIAGGGVYANWGKFASLDATSLGGVRCVFVLTDEFFENVRLNTMKIGKNVLKTINENITAQSLKKAGYSETLLRKLGYESVKGYDEYVDVNIPNEPYYMQDHKYSYFEVNITQNSDITQKYTVEYTIGENDKKVIELDVLPRKESCNKISLKDEKKGVQNLDIKVFKDGQLVGYDSARICLIDFYKPTPLDKFTKTSINVVTWQTEENASRDRTSLESFLDINDRLAEAGFTKVRFSPEWVNVEREKGAYNFGDNFYKRILSLKENGVHINNYLVAYGNYYVAKGEIEHKMFPPNTLDGINAYVDYAVAADDWVNDIYKTGDAIDNIEVWNEPNLATFWHPKPDFIGYSQLINAAAFKFNKRKPDVGIMAGSITAADNQLIFDAMHRNNLLMYSDQISIHPYSYPNDPDGRWKNRVPEYLEAFERYGGWMDVAMTEVGWPTHDAYNTTPYDLQAIYMIKLLVYADEMGFSSTDIFSARDLGLQKSYVEHGFGIFEYNDRPKPSVASLSFFNNTNSDAVYAGEFEITEGVRSFLYKKPGEKNPYAICWIMEEGNEKEYTLKDNEFAKDIYGNKIEGKTITIGKSPVYIFSLPNSTYIKAIAHDTMAIYDELTEKLGEKFDFSLLKELSERAAKSKGSYSDCKKYLDEYFDIAEKYIDLTMNDEDMTYENSALVAYIMFKKGESMAASLEGLNMDYSSYLKNYEAIKREVADKKGDEPDSSLLYTDAMLRYAYKYNKYISAIKKMNEFSGKKARMGYYGYVIDKVSDLARAMIKHEEPDSSKAILTYTTQTRQNMYKGEKRKMKATLENLRKTDFSGTAVWVDENEAPIGEEIPLNVKAGEACDFEIEGTAPVIRDAGTYVYKILYKENGRVMKKQEMEVNLSSLVDLDLVASEKTLSNLDNITVEVKSTYDDEFVGKLILEAPDGWVVESEKEVSIPSGETIYVDFKVEKAAKVKYNEYFFKMRMLNEAGEEVATRERMLDFRIMVYDNTRFNPENFTGDIQGWENAYPIYIEAPENPSDINSWIGLNRSMKVLSKWNEDALYFMVDVYDSVHNNTFTGFDLWQGDSVQIAIDTLLNGLAPNTKSGFQSDDYEYGFGLTPSGLETYVYYGPDVKVGQIETQMFNMVRNDELGLARYLIKLPKENIKQVNLKQGNRFGFNIAVNDADVLLREGFSQYTSGICDSKNPSLYKTFELVAGDNGEFTQTDKIAFYQKVEELRTGF